MTTVLRVSFLFLASAAACGPSTVDPGPLPFDAGVMDIGVQTDAGPSDAGPSGDAMVIDAGPGDESIRGTTLEGIAVEASPNLELCSAWREGRSIAGELAFKVHLTLALEARASLGSGHLASGKLDRGRLRRGPLAADIHELNAGASALVTYQLRDPNGATSLFAELEHTVPGGQVIEAFNVHRVAGDRRPVVVDDALEHYFAFRPDGQPDTSLLEPCGGSSRLERGVFILDATTGGRGLTIVRFANTSLAAAGSAPMVPTGGILVEAGQSYDPIPFRGFWSQTYAAQHHNWEEESVFDFTRDLALFKTVYEPFVTGVGTPIRSEMITRVALAHVGSSGSSPTVTVSRLDTGTGATRDEVLPASANWARVDSTFLLATFFDCSPASVVGIGTGFSTMLQLVRCPRSAPPGFDLREVVPVLFGAEPSQVGRRISGSAIVPITDQGRAGWQVTVGTHRVRLTKDPSVEWYFFEVLDAQGTSLESSLAGELALDQPPRDETLVSETASADVRAVLVRRWAGQGVGESSIFAPVSFELSFGGSTHRVEAWDSLVYTNTHHNWEDRLVAKGDGLTMHWSVRWESGPLVYRVSAIRDSDGVVVLPETIVEER